MAQGKAAQHPPREIHRLKFFCRLHFLAMLLPLALWISSKGCTYPSSEMLSVHGHSQQLVLHTGCQWSEMKQPRGNCQPFQTCPIPCHHFCALCKSPAQAWRTGGRRCRLLLLAFGSTIICSSGRPLWLMVSEFH